jgi:hypothetical protein
MNADGTNQTQLTNNTEPDESPVSRSLCTIENGFRVPGVGCWVSGNRVSGIGFQVPTLILTRNIQTRYSTADS